jgi:FdhD protein
LYTEGVIRSAAELREVRYCVRTPDPAFGEIATPVQEYNIVTVEVHGDIAEGKLRRAGVTSSSCGLCGTDSIDHILTAASPLTPAEGSSLDVATLLALPDLLRAAQPVFERTGGLHGVGLFRSDGTAVAVREDVGRHNAVDKVIGSRLLAEARSENMASLVLVVSGRVSLEIVQKAATARIATIVAVGAPTSLAIDAAERLGCTLVGFVNAASANIYTHGHRVTDAT